MNSDSLSRTLFALSDPTRRALLNRLSKNEDVSVSELAEPFKMSLPGITKHLKVLEKAGLVTKTRKAQWRKCKLNPNPLKEVLDWVHPYRKFWEENLNLLDDYLKKLQALTKAKATENKTL